MGQVYWKLLLFLFHFQISKLKNICAAVAFSVHFDSHRFSTLIDVFLMGREFIVSKNSCKFSSTIDFLCLLVVSANYLFDIFWSLLTLIAIYHISDAYFQINDQAFLDVEQTQESITQASLCSTSKSSVISFSIRDCNGVPRSKWIVIDSIMVRLTIPAPRIS